MKQEIIEMIEAYQKALEEKFNSYDEVEQNILKDLYDGRYGAINYIIEMIDRM